MESNHKIDLIKPFPFDTTKTQRFLLIAIMEQFFSNYFNCSDSLKKTSNICVAIVFANNYSSFFIYHNSWASLQSSHSCATHCIHNYMEYHFDARPSSYCSKLCRLLGKRWSLVHKCIFITILFTFFLPSFIFLPLHFNK